MRMVGKAIFELIATEGAYVRDLQLVVEVRGHYIYHFIDDFDVRSRCLLVYHVDILFEHVKTLGAQDECDNIFEH